MQKRFIAFTIALTAILGGCGAPSWTDFDLIQLARPLPANLPGGMERTVLGAGYIGPHKSGGSTFGSDLRIANALADTNDLVTARSCLTVAVAHRLFYVQTSFRYAIEADITSISGPGRAVPDELKLVASVSQKVAATPADARVAGFDDSEKVMPVARGEIARCMSVMGDALFETRGEPDGSDISRMRNKKYAGASVRFSNALNESLTVKMAGERIEERLASLPARSGGRRGPEFIPASVPAAMVYNHILLNTLTRPSNPAGAAGASTPHAMYVQYGHDRVLEILSDADTYKGAGGDGFERTWRTLDGMNVRVTSRAGRMGVEITGMVVRDPIMTEVDMGQ